MKKKIGIWGFGLVGKSALNYLINKNFIIEILNKENFTKQEKIFFKNNNISYKIAYKNSDDVMNFLNNNDEIIVSPGIDTSNYYALRHKFKSELDFFAPSWNYPTIAVTGSIGKTSLISLLEALFTEYNYSVKKGGNIGIALFDLLMENPSNSLKNSADKYITLLELSSFQLEYNQHFKPDIAILSNFYPNHLDRHKTLDSYFNAKYNLIKHQNRNQKALIPFSLYLKIKKLEPQSQLFFFTSALSRKELPNISIDNHDTLYFHENNIIYKYHNKKIITLISYHELPALSYKDNWLIIIALLDIMKLNFDIFNTPTCLKRAPNLSIIPEHRLEKVATQAPILYYNDSKSTLMESTVAAVNYIKEQHLKSTINLFLGGLSKGVERAPYMSQIKNKVATAFCFGVESESLYNMCILNNIKAYKFKTLEEAFYACQKILKKDDIVLFSPGGSSYDLFENYKKRGEYFKNLVKKYNYPIK